MLPVKYNVVGVENLRNELLRFAKVMGIDAQVVLKQAGQSIARTAMNWTQPKGTTKKSQQSGERTIRTDVFNALLPRRIDYFDKRGGPPSESEAEAFYKSKRNSDGRVPPQWAKKQTPYTTIAAIIKKRQLLVGRAKGAFGKGVMDLGGGRVPAWVKRHATPGAGGYTLKRNLVKPSITIKSNMAYASSVLTKGKMYTAAEQGARNARKFFERSMNKRAGEFHRARNR